MKKVFPVLAISGMLGLAACSTPGEEYRPDVFDQSQVNQAQDQRVVNIVAVSAARTRVQNEHNHQVSELSGAAIGAGLGAGLGTAFGGGLAGGLAGVAGGAIGGMVGGQVVQNKAIVSSVIVTYDDPRLVGTHSSTQIGRVCEYKLGNALLLLTAQGETRVQPNSECPKNKE